MSLINYSYHPHPILLRYESAYKPYEYILSIKSKEETEQFLMKDRRLADYRKKIDYLKSLISKILIMPKCVPMHLFLIDCSKLNKVI